MMISMLTHILLALLLAEAKVSEYWPKSPLISAANVPELCRAGRHSLDVTVPGIGRVYQPAIGFSPVIGECNADDFEIIEALGKGGYGAVTLVKHKLTGNNYAMKIMRSNSPHRYNILRSEECHHYLATSSDTFAAPASPFIAKFYCSMRLGESTRFLVEYVEGETMMAVLTGGAKAVNGRRRRMKIELGDVDIRTLFAQLVKAIENLHDRGMVFGDLTTRNIMISKDGNLKLIDFGFSKVIGSGKNEPPSWPNGIRQPSFSENPYIDWYAVGSILYEMAYAKKLQTEKPVKPRDIRTEISREFLLRRDCNKAIGDKDLCDLVNKFIQRDAWQKTWGRSEKTRQAIRKHKWFRGFDWSKV